MANLDKYKEQARKLEQKEQWSKAIEQYAKAIETMEKSPEDDTDLSLYNRVGDLYQKVNDTQNAIVYYERAAEKYGDAGFHNNAIALCNKIVRLAPGRSQIYLKLGMLFAAKGFMGEAKQNLLEYADRMQKAGQIEEAFKALKAFAEMTPGQDDIWSVLAVQARAAAKTDEQKEQVEKLLAEFEHKDRVVQRKSRVSRHMITGEELPPEPASKKDLVFLDLGDVPSPRKSGARRAPVLEPPPAVEPPPAAEHPPLEIVSTALSGGEEPVPGGSALDLEPTSLAEEIPAAAELVIEPPPTAPPAKRPSKAAEPAMLDLEMPELEVEEAPSPKEAVAGLPMIGEEAPEAAAAISGLPMIEEEPAGEAMAGLPLIEMEEPAAPSVEFLDLGEVTAAVPTVEELEARIAARPEDWESHRRLGEVLLESGQRERGVAELNASLEGFEQANEFESAYSVAEEVLRLDPNSIRQQQKRVELAFRLNDRTRLVDAYNELADAFLRGNDPAKAVAVYQRVLEHDASNVRARAALDTLAPPQPPPAAAVPAAAPAAEPVLAGAGVGAGGGDFVDLGALLMEDEGPKDTRMRIEDEEPTGDEEADFQTMLQAFKKGIAASVEEEDFQSHYDLGVAYKEMGLLDEAIAEFQKALRATEGRLRSSEALGVCFFEKGQFAVAETILRRGLDMQGVSDADRIGLLYWTGRALEEQGKAADALVVYNRVFAVDITFQDVSGRVQALHARGA